VADCATLIWPAGVLAASRAPDTGETAEFASDADEAVKVTAVAAVATAAVPKNALRVLSPD